MAIHNEDPCKDIRPPNVESTGDGGSGQEVPPQPDDPQDELIGLFPSYEIETEIKAVDRSVFMIDQQLFFLPGYYYELRTPGAAFGSLMRNDTRSTSSLDNPVDQFRYVIGKTYNSLWAQNTGRIRQVNPAFSNESSTLRLQYHPGLSQNHRVDGRIPNNTPLGLPFSVEHFNVFTPQNNGEPNSEHKSVTIFDLRFSPDSWNPVIEFDYEQKRQLDIEVDPLPPLLEQYENYIMGQDYAGLRGETYPLFPLRNAAQGDFIPNRFLDHTFEAPAAFFRKEVENSNLPIQDSVSIESVVNFAPDPNWDEQERQIEIEEMAAEDGVVSIERIQGEDPQPIELGVLMPDEDDQTPTEHRMLSIYKKFHMDYEDGEPPTFSDMSQKYQIFSSDATQRMLHVNSEATDVSRQSNFYNESAELLKHHAKISFSMHHNTGPGAIPRMMSRAEMDLEQILDGESYDAIDAYIFNLLAMKYPSDGTFFTQIIDQSLTFFDPLNRAARGQVDELGLNDKIKKDYRPQSILNFPSKIEGYYSQNNFQENNLQERNFPLGAYQRANRGDINLRINHLVADILAEYGSSRTYKDILSGKMAHSEVIGYRIEKIDTLTGDVLQNFYIYNDPDIIEFDFLDTQVVYAKKYTYRIYTINIVIGNEYSYEISNAASGENFGPGQDGFQLNSPLANDEEIGDYSRNSGGRMRDYSYHPQSGLRQLASQISKQARLEVKARSKPMLSIIEAPYFQQIITIGDLPPLYPEVSYRPYVGRDDMVEFVFSPRSGDFLEKPIPILSGDQEALEKMVTAQVPDEEGRIKYTFDSNVKRYEILSLEEPPVSYLSFVNSKLVKVSGRAPSKNLMVVPNKDYYVCFRAVDDAGFSNPSPVYRYNLQSYGNGIEHIFEVYDFVEQNSYRMQTYEMTLENTISIKPSTMQRTVNFSATMEDGQTEMQIENYTTAPDINDLHIGNVEAEDSVWNRKFKFRFKSRTTGKSIDFNIKFKKFRKIGDLYEQFGMTRVNASQILDVERNISSVLRRLSADRESANRNESNMRARGEMPLDDVVEAAANIFSNLGTGFNPDDDSGGY